MEKIKKLFKNQVLKKVILSVLLVIVIFIVPVRTLSELNYNSWSIRTIDSFEFIMEENVNGLFFIPIILSILLFGKIYKENQEPIENKKKYFCLKTLLGAMIILLIQILTALAICIYAKFYLEIFVFYKIILKALLLMTLAYLQCFIIANLALVISRNIQTQIVITLLMMFLLPIMVTVTNRDNIDKYWISTNEEVMIGKRVSKEEKFDLLNRIFFDDDFVTYEKAYTESIIKTVIIMAVALLLGIVLFEKINREKIDKSFVSDLIHLIVKSLLLLPNFLLFNKLNSSYRYVQEETFGVIELVGIAIIAYFIYDLLLWKKIGVKKNLLCMIVMFVGLQVLTAGVTKDWNSGIDTMISSNNTKGVYVGIINPDNFSNVMNKKFITDKELISKIYENYLTDPELYDEDSKLLAKDMLEINYYIKLDTNKIYKISSYISREKLKEFCFMLENETSYEEELKNSLKIDNECRVGIFENDINTTDEFQEKILNRVRKDVEDYSLYDLCELFKPEMELDGFVKIKKYYEGELKNYNINIKKDEELGKLEVDYFNSKAIEEVKNADKAETIEEYENTDDKKVLAFSYVDKDESYYAFLSKEFEEFMLNNSNVDTSKEYVIVFGANIGADFSRIGKLKNSSDSMIFYYTNNTEELAEIMNKYTILDSDEDEEELNADDIDLDEEIDE